MTRKDMIERLVEFDSGTPGMEFDKSQVRAYYESLEDIGIQRRYQSRFGELNEVITNAPIVKDIDGNELAIGDHVVIEAKVISTYGANGNTIDLLRLQAVGQEQVWFDLISTVVKKIPEGDHVYVE